MNVLSVLNKKGGVGKTTVASHLAQALGLIGKKILVIDNDEQHNLSRTLGIGVGEINLFDIYNSNADESVIQSTLLQTLIENVHCITGSAKLAGVKVKNDSMKKIVQSATIQAMHYDVIIIDNCPSFDEKTRTAIFASDFYLIPVQLKQLAVDGLTEVMSLMTKTYGIDNSKIRILLNFWKNTNHRNAMKIAVESMFPENVLSTVVPEDEAVDEVVTENKSIFLSRSKAKCVAIFEDICCEMFGFEKDYVWEKILEARKRYRADLSRENLKRTLALANLNEPNTVTSTKATEVTA